MEPFAPHFEVDLVDQVLNYDNNLNYSVDFHYYPLPKIVQFNLTEKIEVKVTSFSRYSPNFIQWDPAHNKFVVFGLTQAYIGNYSMGVRLTSPSTGMSNYYQFSYRIYDNTTYITDPATATIPIPWTVTYVGNVAT